MRSNCLVACVALTLLVVAPIGAQETMFASNGGAGASPTNTGAILTVDPTNANVTVVGVPTDPTDPEGLPGIDFNASGQLFAVTGEGGALGAPHLLEVDPADGSLINNVGLLLESGGEVGLSDLSYQPGTGTLFGFVAYGGVTVEEGWLVTVDTTTGVVTAVGYTGLVDWGAIAFATDGTLYHVNFESSLPAELHTLDPATGAVLTTVSLSNHYMSLAVRPSDGTLFATQRNVAGAPVIGDLYTIDPATGVETFIGATGNPIHDLAFQEPFTPPVDSAIPTIGLAGMVALVLFLAVVGILRLRN